ncbi:MAG: hypothetical protein L0I76_03340 [Pseudonocardia sp.]|nr:hypothetical protein [Pseudonocardia sp.]
MSAADIVRTIADLIGSIVWPALVLTVFLVLKDPLKEMIRNIKSLSVSAAGVEGTVTVKENVATALTAAVATKSGADASTAGVIADARTAAGRAVELVRRADGSTTRLGLWVDDIPDNNRYERAALEAMGLRFDLCTSTEEAEQLLVQPDLYSVIVSDMSRPPDGAAGLTLLDLLRDRQIRTPCIIYARAATPQQIAETKGRGGMGQTSDPNELVEMVAAALSLPAQP